MNNTTKYYSLIIAVVVLFAMMTVSCEKSPVDKGTDETDRMIDIRTSIEALTKSPALDGNGEGNFSNGRRRKFLQRGYLYACGFGKRFPEYKHKLHCRDD